MKTQTKKVLCLLVAIASVLTIVSAVSYAYFTAMADIQEQSATLTTGTMNATFADGNAGVSAELKFGESVTKTFSIQNTGTLESTVQMYWEDLINTYTYRSLSYTLSQSATENGTYTNLVTNRNVPVANSSSRTNLATDIRVPANMTYYYRLVIKLNYLENINQDADVSAKFNTKFALGNEKMKNTIVDEIVNKANDDTVTTYEGGNKGEMFTFSHEATTQTPVQTDYRYIGANPNSYVTFNGETWRIIGVFETENSAGTKEQRIKIVRQETLGDLAWDSGNSNEWSTASLKTLLNGDYYNRTGSYASTGLSEEAKKMIEPAKWYLGGSNTYRNLGGPNYYNFERGETTYNNSRTTNIVQNVGLIYPSDYIYTYANGVDSKCYKDGYNCDTSTPVSGWMFNMFGGKTQWTAAPDSSYSGSAFLVNSLGHVNGNGGSASSRSYGVCPVVYLKSSVKLVDGDGTQESPYVLE